MHMYNTYFGTADMRSSAILDYERETVVFTLKKFIMTDNSASYLVFEFT